MHAHDIPDPQPKSAARLAAEELFVQRRPQATGPDGAVPVVTMVSRRRVLAPADDGAATAPAAAPALKTPRVFVLRPASATAEPPADAGPQAPVPAVPVRRRRTRAAPVTVIYSAPPGPSAEERAAARAEAELPSSTRLAQALAAVDPILADIRAAMSFDIRPHAQTAEWDRLGAQADRIAQDLADWALSPFTPPPDPLSGGARRR